MIGEAGSLADQWLTRFAGPDASSIPYAELADERVAELADWPRAAEVQAIDYLCGDDPGDPTGEALAGRLAAFVKALIPYRVAQAQSACRLTVVTRRAVLEVAEPRAGAVWGALRAISQEVAARGRHGRACRLPAGGRGFRRRSGDPGVAGRLRPARGGNSRYVATGSGHRG